VKKFFGIKNSIVAVDITWMYEFSLERGFCESLAMNMFVISPQLPAAFCPSVKNL
jgi:cyanate permease